MKWNALQECCVEGNVPSEECDRENETCDSPDSIENIKHDKKNLADSKEPSRTISANHSPAAHTLSKVKGKIDHKILLS